jgi:hypothetical protein
MIWHRRCGPRDPDLPLLIQRSHSGAIQLNVRQLDQLALGQDLGQFLGSRLGGEVREEVFDGLCCRDGVVGQAVAG